MAELSATDILNRVLYHDDDIIVLNKPQGIPVHRTPKGGEHLEQYFDALRFGEKRTPSLAHRLDKETSGCLVLGRTRESLARLSKWFEQGKIQKHYWAIVDGVPAEDMGVISMPIARRDLGRGKWQFLCAEDGQAAITHYKVLEQNATNAWLEMSPVTGRTHQLRLHASYMGWAIKGDAFYGVSDGVLPLMLHAYRITIPQPYNPKLAKQLIPIEVVCAPTDAMAACIKAEGWNYIR